MSKEDAPLLFRISSHGNSLKPWRVPAGDAVPAFPEWGMLEQSSEGAWLL